MTYLTDIHTHTNFSADGESSMADMVNRAKAMGMACLGISEHFDLDYAELNLLVDGAPVPMTDAEAYFTEGRKWQKACLPGLKLLLGCEFGFHESPRVARKKAEILARYRPDFIVNSVHTVDGQDCWFPAYFAGKDKKTAYTRYLKRVYQSLAAEPYDIVAHLGYVARNAPYADPKLRYEEFAPLLDDILAEIVRRGKILEVNSSARTAGSDFLPDTDILQAYYRLGGRKVSFASDAHAAARLCDKRDRVTAALRQIGFTHLTVPCQGAELAVVL